VHRDGPEDVYRAAVRLAHEHPAENPDDVAPVMANSRSTIVMPHRQ
jgi:hypothetical protein